jgi:hypothetical protein
MTLKPDRVYHIDHKPLSDKIDLVERVHEGINYAVRDGMEWCFIIEDDYYPEDYFASYADAMQQSRKNILGSEETVYYNLRNRTFATFHHPRRASLFTTAFRSNIPFTTIAGNNLQDPFLDIKLWGYFTIREHKEFVNAGAIGIKHSLGLCAGKGHKMIMPNEDPNLHYIGKFIKDHMALDFYRSLSEELYKP